MKVYFIGAGPGASDLITLRGANLLKKVPIVLYAGSLIPADMLEHCRTDAEIINTAELNLEEQEAYYIRAHKEGKDVARLHSGDPAIYGATAEQMARLEKLGIEFEIVPGVSSFTTAAASIKAELTKPAVSQTIILTRVSSRASAIPEMESIIKLAEHRSTMCIFLSGKHLEKIVPDLLQFYDADTPVALVYRASWPDERSYQGTLSTILKEINIDEWSRTTMFLVGHALSRDVATESSLYSKDYSHIFRTALK